MNIQKQLDPTVSRPPILTMAFLNHFEIKPRKGAGLLDVTAPHIDQLDWEGDSASRPLLRRPWLRPAGVTVRPGEPGD